jgi:subtilase family serine protease
MRSSWARSLTLLGAASLAIPMVALQWNADASTAGQSRTTLPGSAPSWATHSALVGAAKAASPIQFRVYLAPRGGQQALTAALMAVSTPGSAQYRHFLTPAQYRARFAPSSAAVAAVRSWLAGTGVRVNQTAFGNRYVAATGTSAAVHAAFGVTENLYRHDGRIERAPSGDISVPAALAGRILGVTGLETDQVMKSATAPDYPPPAGFRNAHPCSAYAGKLLADHEADGTTPLPKFEGAYRHYAVCGYTPTQFRGAYGASDSGLTGAGATVAITDAYASPTMLRDANRYATNNGGEAFQAGQYTESTPAAGYRRAKRCGPSGWFGEESLDVEAVHGMAPSADVEYYAAASCYDSDFRQALTRVVDDNTADFVTDSWGEASQYLTSGAIAAYEQIFQQAGLQGIGILYSSGDSGDDVKSTGVKQTDYPASDPYVTAVGGTSTSIKVGNVLNAQTGWGTDKYSLSDDGQSWVPFAANPFQYGAGGGFSSLFNRPDYQDGVVPDGSPAGRGVPDIAMDADPTTGMLIGETQSFPEGRHYGEYRIGGTSLASPLMAGMQALAMESAGGRIGFANPAIYDLARSGGTAFDDVKAAQDGRANVRPDFVNGLDPSDGIVYSIRTFGDDASLRVTKGWDAVTGVGSPNGDYLDAMAGS